MQRATLGQSSSQAASFVVIRSDSESIFKQQFGENHGNDCSYSIYFDRSTRVWLSRSLEQVSNDDT